MGDITVNSVVRVYNDSRVKLGIVKGFDGSDVIIQGIFSKVVNVEYKVKRKDVEPINLLKELDVQKHSKR